MFGKRNKPNPSVSMDWAELTYDSKIGGWALSYRDVHFDFPGPQLRMPDKAKLDIYLDWIERHREHIDQQVAAMAAGFDDVYVNADAAHVASIEIEQPNRIVVMILGAESWGDMGYDLWIENGEIVNQGFAD